MRLSKKQKELSVKLFGSDRLTRRQFSRAMDELKEARKEASQAAYEEANEADLLALAEANTEMRKESQRYQVGPCPMPNCQSSDDGFFVDTSGNIGGCRRCLWEKNGQGAGAVGFIASLLTLEPYEARDYILGREISVMAIAVLHSREKKGQKGKIDANDLLLAGQLGTLLSHLLANAVTTREFAPTVPTTKAPNEVAWYGVETASDELLLFCGFIADDVGTDEALILYKQAEGIYMTQTATDLFNHYKMMKRLTTSHTQAKLPIHKPCTRNPYQNLTNIVIEATEALRASHGLAK